MLAIIVFVIVIMDQLMEADKYSCFRTYTYIIIHLFIHAIFHNKTSIKEREKEKRCDRWVKNVCQIKVHTPSSMTYSCEYLGKSYHHLRLMGPASLDILRIK